MLECWVRKEVGRSRTVEGTDLEGVCIVGRLRKWLSAIFRNWVKADGFGKGGSIEVRRDKQTPERLLRKSR